MKISAQKGLVLPQRCEDVSYLSEKIFPVVPLLIKAQKSLALAYDAKKPEKHAEVALRCIEQAWFHRYRIENIFFSNVIWHQYIEACLCFGVFPMTVPPQGSYWPKENPNLLSMIGSPLIAPTVLRWTLSQIINIGCAEFQKEAQLFLENKIIFYPAIPAQQQGRLMYQALTQSYFPQDVPILKNLHTAWFHSGTNLMNLLPLLLPLNQIIFEYLTD